MTEYVSIKPTRTARQLVAYHRLEIRRAARNLTRSHRGHYRFIYLQIGQFIDEVVSYWNNEIGAQYRFNADGIEMPWCEEAGSGDQDHPSPH